MARSNQRVKITKTPLMSTQSNISKCDEEKDDFVNSFGWKEQGTSTTQIGLELGRER